MKKHPLAGSRFSLLKILLLIWIFSFPNFSCKKDAVPANQTNNPAGVNRQQTKKMIANKTVEWKVYPYIGGPGEDSAYSLWSSYLGPYGQIDSIVIISTDHKRYHVTQATSISADNPAYLYQPGVSLNDPTKILLWWIQKVPGARPDADSAYFYLKF